mmetsp:Transcript_2699/g.9698  ORF Transcript_2699/g.9698 Transcript_2699/m.9698 type:complete len:90 (-) Transcript_2699:153-422(-)
MTSLGTESHARVSINSQLGWVSCCASCLSVSDVCLARVRAWSDERVRAPRVPALRCCAPRVRAYVRCVFYDARGSGRGDARYHYSQEHP